jgi:hypothetical protein
VFQSLDAQILAVAVAVGGESVGAASPRRLFRLPFNQSQVAATANADRFLVSEYPYAAGQTVHVLTNWYERLTQGK